MARSCGIHIDQGHFHLVALEGSAKKHKVLECTTGAIPPGEDPVDAVARALRGTVRRKKLNADNVGLAVDSGLAAFRSLTVPFDDREKTEEIIKFEIESDLPHWDIDDVVVDFLVLSSKPGVESRLLVTALPKERLERKLLACERGGLEASEAELDGTALFEAASACGVTGAESAQVLMHVGDSTTAVVVVDGGRLVTMRAIRAGALPRQRMAFDPESTGEEAPEGEEPPPAQRELDREQRERMAGTVKRIRRELARTIEAAQTLHPIEAVHVSGHLLDGLLDRSILDVPLVALRGLPFREVTDPEGGSPSADVELCSVAYGAALRALGAGQLQPHLRREELRFTGKFERMELPLAVFGLLLCTLLGVKLIVNQKRIDWRDTGNIEQGQPGDMQVWLEYSNAYLFPDPENGSPGRLKSPPQEILDLARAAENGQLSDTKYRQLRRIKDALNREIERIKKMVGVITDEKPPQSALHASILVLGVFAELDKDVGRFAIRTLSADYRPARGSQPDRVEVKLDLDFFGETDVVASQNYARFKRAVEAKPWCTEYPEKSSEPFEDGGGGVFYRGVTITVDVDAALAAMEAAGGAES